MKVSGICMVTDNMDAMLAYYESLFEQKFRGEDQYRFIEIDHLIFSICHEVVEKAISPNYQLPSKGSRCIIEIFTDQVEVLYERAKALGLDISKPLKTEAWGVTSFWLTDIEGHTISFLYKK